MSIQEMQVEQFVSALIAGKLNTDVSNVKANQSLFSIGVTSLLSEEILTNLNENFEGLPSTFLFEQPTVAKITSYLSKLSPKKNAPILALNPMFMDAKEGAVEGSKANNKEAEPAIPTIDKTDKVGDIAIIGISGKFPKSADTSALWSNLLGNVDCVTTIPEKRWDVAGLFSEDKSDRGALFGKWGGFIDDIEYFDPSFFQIPYREAEIMDPQQKLFLECGWALMEYAGYGNIDDRATDNIGVYAGVTWNEFSLIAHDVSLSEQTYKGAGSLYWSIPNRLSYTLNLNGPSVAIDSACSSSLVAIQDACMALQSNKCDMAIAGGVNLNLHPDKYLFLSQNHFLSSEGKCRSFGEGGDGYVPSEGVATVLLKPLSDAQRDGDYIYGVIKSATNNHGGKVTGYTVPNPHAHAQLIQKAMSEAGVNARDISYVECHGTGTELGDPIEISGLSAAYQQDTSKKQFCAIGSIKSNIGHLEAAAGVTGLIKILLSMQHNMLPASLHAADENKKLNLSSSPFYIVKENQKWLEKGKRLLAGISSFGAGGSNAHLIVENYDRKHHLKGSVNSKILHAVILSSQSKEQLKQHVTNLRNCVKQYKTRVGPIECCLGDIAYSLVIGRSHFSHRVVFLARTITELDKELGNYLSGKAKLSKNIVSGTLTEVEAVQEIEQAAISRLSKFSAAKWAEMWTKGSCLAKSYLQLKSIQNVQPFLRIPLPHYSFLKERSWITEGYPLATRGKLGSKETRGKVLHPIVDMNVSTLYEQKFEKTFTTDEFVLADHLVNDVNVIPGVCHLEMIRLCASEAIKERIKIIKDVWYYNVIEVDESRKVDIELNVEEDALTFTILDNATDTIFSRGKVYWEQSTSSNVRIEDLNVSEVEKTLDKSWPIKDVYEKFVATGVIQKGSFQVIKKIEFGKTQALSRLKLPTNLVEQFSEYVFHPALMDGLVQTAMMHLQYLHGEDIKILPFHFSQVSFIAPLENEVFVHCKLKELATKEFDLTIYSLNGLPLVEVQGFILKQMKSGAKALLNPSDSVATELVSETYYSPKWIEKPLIKTGYSPNVTLCFVSGDTDLSLVASDNTIIWLKNGPSIIEHDAGYELNMCSEEQIKALVELLEVKNQLPDLILYSTQFLSLQQTGSITSNELETDPLSLFCIHIFCLTKALISKRNELQIVVFTNAEKNIDNSLKLAASGFFKTLKVEKPGFIGRVVTLEDNLDSLSQLVQQACAEVSTQNTVLDVIYNDTKRYYKSFANVSVTEEILAETAFQKNGCYIITGGTGGIGLVFALHLLKVFSSQVYLLGRTEFNDEKRTTLEALNKGNGKAHYIQCDVTSLDSTRSAVKHVMSEQTKLNGVIHSAGVIDDGFILRKERESVERVVKPKVNGTVNLDIATEHLELDFFCLFSSVTAILGNLGQCDYGYANSFLDNFVSARNALASEGSRKGKAFSINWPYWKNGGMQLTAKEEEQLSKTFGFTPLSNQSGLDAFAFAGALDIENFAVLEGDQAKIREVINIAEEVKSSKNHHSGSSSQDTYESALSYLMEIFAKELKIPKDKIDINSSFERYGFDSIVMIDLINIMDKKFDNLPKTLFFEYQTIDALANYFVANHSEKFELEPVVTAPSHRVHDLATASEVIAPRSVQKGLRFNKLSNIIRPEAPLIQLNRSEQSIAIIGMSGRFPQSENLEQYWENLKSAKDCVSEIPETRWDWKEHFKAGSPQKGKSYGKWGGFLDDVDKFDASFFNITPKEAEVIDPQERLFLQCATSAIQDAGYTSDKLANHDSDDSESKTNPVGVFVGVMWGDYQLHGVASEDNSAWTTPRSFFWGIANRVSYFHNFTGPSMAIDTACSSSLSAIHLACESIRNGEVDVALAGGVNLSLHPNKYNLLSEMQFLSTDGRCRSFGDGGNGYVPGDGVGAFILKPLAQAELDGDHVYGVIKGSTLNHGGKSSGFTVPNPLRQAELIKNAMQKAGVSPRHISYVEAHGTGTSLGDPVEMIGLNKAYQQEDKQYCAIGSVKSNIGHLEAAAGAAALSKVLLQMKHKQLVPSIHSSELNSNIDFADTPFEVQQDLTDWPRSQFIDESQDDKIVEIPRLAGISSFGAGGSNAHIIVEEYNQAVKQNTTAPTERDPVAILLSATNQTSLNIMVQQLLNFVEQNEHAHSNKLLRDIAFTLQTGREHFDFRCAFVVENFNGFKAKLSELANKPSDSNHHIENVFVGDISQKSLLVPLFIEESDSEGILDKWFTQRLQSNLAVAWASGVKVDWQRLYEDAETDQYSRVSLPTYAFSKKRFWTSLPSGGANLASLHPLLDRNISNIGQQLFVKEFKPQNELLSDHVINKIPTLPGSAFVEMAMQAVKHTDTNTHTLLSSENEFQIEINDVVWAKAISTFNKSTMTRVELVPFDSGFVFEISKSSEQAVLPKASSWVPCSQGKLKVVSQNSANITSKDIDVESLINEHDEIEKSALYQKLFAVGYEFGEKFDVFSDIRISESSAIVTIDSKSIQQISEYVIHPIILDASFRACLGVGYEKDSNISLQIPVEMETLVLFEKLNQDCIAHAKRLATLDSVGSQQTVYDIDIFTPHGRLIAQIKGFKTQTAKIQSSVSPKSENQGVKPEIVDNTQQNSDFREQIESYLKFVVSRASKIEEDDIASDVALDKYGIDSVMIMQMNESLEKVFGELPKTLFFEYQDIRGLGHYFVQHYLSIIKQKLTGYKADAEPVQDQKTELEQSTLSNSLLKNLNDFRTGINKGFSNKVEQDIAVIGISGRFPDAESTDELWNVLSEGRDCIREIPEGRWDANEFYEKGTLELGKTSAKWGGFIDGHDCFDAALFNVLPSQAESMDPQERVFLQSVWATLEDAGYTASSLAREQLEGGNVGVFAGSMWNHYDLVGLEESLKGNPTINFTWDAAVANRVSYFFNFKGPSMMVDTACSTSLLAVHMACESIRKGECKYAVAGGVNLSLHPYKYELLTQMQMLSPKGRCHSFGAEADGYVPGEGVGTVLLKPLSQAIADNDSIYGVIKGGAANHNGKTNGFTVPSVLAQEECFELALKSASLSAEDISYFEAHGTGTSLGDPIEFTALNKVFTKSKSTHSQCALGSLKSNIGHLEGAAGVASLIKVLLQMKHKKIAASLHSSELNPKIDFASSPLYVPQTLTDWQTEGKKRSAAMASMGAGGANTCLVVQEYIGEKHEESRQTSKTKKTNVFIFSAKSLLSLKRNITDIAAYINRNSRYLLAEDVAYTLQVGRVALEYRLAVVASSLVELADKLLELAKSGPSDSELGSLEHSWSGHFATAMDKGWHSSETDENALRNFNSLEWEEIAKAWISGTPVDWPQLYTKKDGSCNVSRISLPTYGFEKTVYWPKVSSPVRKIGSGNSKNQGSLTDLLDSNMSTFQWQSFQKIFEPDQFFIRSHKVGKQSVVPGVILLEMAIQSYSKATLTAIDSPQVMLEFNQLTWLSPGFADIDLITEIRLLPNHSRFEVAAVTDSTANKQYSSLFTGSIRRIEGDDLNLHHLPSLQRLLADLSLTNATASEIYDYYDSVGLHYSDYFQVTSALWLDEESSLVKIQPFADEKIENSAIEPSVYDAALRSTLLALRQKGWHQLLIPDSIEQLQVVSTLAGEAYAHVQLIDYDQELKTYAYADITIYNETGGICSVIRGFKAVASSLSEVNVSSSKTLSAQNNLSTKTGSIAKTNISSVSQEELKSKAMQFVAKAFTKATGIEPTKVKSDRTFESMGVDSITIVKLNKIFEKDFAELSKTVFFECNTISKVKDYLIENHFDELCIACALGQDESAPTSDRPQYNEAKKIDFNGAQNNLDTPTKTPSEATELNTNVFVAPQRFMLPFNENDNAKRLENSVVVLLSHESVPKIDGIHTVSVKFGKVFRQLNDGERFIIRQNNPKDFLKLISSLLKKNLVPDVFGIFETNRLDWNVKQDFNRSETFKQTLSSSVDFLQNVIKAFTQTYSQLSARILHFHLGTLHNAQPQWEAYSGLANSLPDINNKLFMSNIAIDPGLVKNEVVYSALLKNELLCEQRDFISLEYDIFGMRSTYLLKELTDRFSTSTGKKSDLPIESGGVYLISGGAGALGKIICKYLVECAELTKINISIGLLGRSSINERFNQLEQDLSSEYATVFYAQGDISIEASIKERLVDIRHRYGDICGVIHSAGVSAEKGLLTSNQGEFFNPLKAKCLGTVNLDLLTRDDPLRFFLMFSSITAQIGDFGAGAYAIGNSFQDNYAVHREFQRAIGQCRGVTQAIAWPLWSAEGLDKNQEVLELYLDDFGMKAIDENQGIDILRSCWTSQISQVAIYFGMHAKITEKLRLNTLPELVNSRVDNQELEEKDSESKARALQISESHKLRLLYDSLFDQEVGVKQDDLYDQEIAVIGLNGAYPEAKNVDEFWQNLYESKDCISEIPVDRWDYKEMYSPDREEKGKVNSKWGGFIDEVDNFDAQYFEVAPREAQLMDPQQRLFLQAAYNCVEDAGYSKSALKHAKVAVYVGVMWGQYQLFDDVAEEQLQYGRPGASFASVANRVSYYFDFSGPSVAIDTMCSSSLTAIHHARKSLLSGECEYALAGGVNLSLHPSKYQLLAQGNYLSSDGRCRPFSSDADGYVPGEGIGVVMLKKLSAAIRDGDNIQGIIKSTAINHGGRSHTYTAPNPIPLSEVVSSALKESKWDPRTISYVEAHGTGTPLGDAIEVTALTKAYQSHTKGSDHQKQYCAIGSVKSNIGHSESASSIAGLTKVLLQMKHKTIVPSIHSETLNSNINFENSPFKVARQNTFWEQPTVVENGKSIVYPRRAGLSTFGAGGSNAHLLIEEYCSPKLNIRRPSKSQTNIFVFSAKSIERLNLMFTPMFGFLQDLSFDSAADEVIFLANMAFTLQVGREHETVRLAIIAESLSDLIDKLSSAKAGDSLHEYFLSTAGSNEFSFDDILDEKQKEGLVETFVVKGDLTGLARIWTNSINVEWASLTKRLYYHFSPIRISLPTTSFITRRHWVKMNDGKHQNLYTENLSGVPKIHPLIDRNISTLYSQQYYKQLTGQEFYLRDNVIGFQERDKVLPTAAHLEMVRAASEEALGANISGLSNLTWDTSITVDHLPKDIFIEMESSEESLSFALKSHSQQGLCTHLRGITHLPNQQVVVPRPLDIQRIIKAVPTRLSAESLYQYFDLIGLRYGPSMRVVKQIQTSSVAALAELDFAQETPGKSDFYLHPSLINAALSICLSTGSMGKYDDSLAPFEVDNLYIYKPVQSACYAYVKLVNGTDNIPGTTKQFDVTITNLKGEVLVQMEGVSTQNLKHQKEPEESDNTQEIFENNNAAIADTLESEALVVSNLNDFLIGTVASVIAMSPEQYEAHDKFQNYGMDSVMLHDLYTEIEKTFNNLPKTLLFEYDSVTSLSDYLMGDYREEVQLKFAEDDGEPHVTVNRQKPSGDISQETLTNTKSSSNRQSTEVAYTQNTELTEQKAKFGTLPKYINQRHANPGKRDNRIAVIGMSGLFPESLNLDEFWENVRKGKNCLKEIPQNRWPAELYFNQSKSAQNGMSSSKWGGFIDDVYHFDAPFFNISEDEAKLMDPQLRLMMKIAYQTVEDAGYNPADLHQQKMGVYIGVMNNDFTWTVSEAYSTTGRYFGPGSFASDIANRVSTLLNVVGPSLSVETACASSSTAIHLARKAIIEGECVTALAGGVNVSLHQGKYLMLDQVKVLAPDGMEKTFDDSANGLVPGEGVGAVMLKPFDQAVDDGDHIYGVLSGTSIGHSGIGPAANLPSVGSLEKNIVKAIEESGIDAGSLSYIESHGTGTALGDPIELKALNNALGRYSNKINYCAIGTKANLGHLEAASGICSLIKVLSGFKHQEIAPCANLAKVNRAFDVEKSHFYFPDKCEQWTSNGSPRIAGINSFGLGGSNAFLIVESHQQIESTLDESPQIIVITANSKRQLLQQANKMLSFAKQNLHINFADFAFTLQIGRKHFPFRLALVAKNMKAFVRMVTKYIAESDKLIRHVVTNHTGIQSRLDTGTLERAMETRDLSKVASFWAQGAKVDWSILHIAGRTKCSLPTYPFNEKECRLVVSEYAKDHAKGIKAETNDERKVIELQEFEARWFTPQHTHSSTGKVFGKNAKEDALTKLYWKDNLQNVESAKPIANLKDQSHPIVKRVSITFEKDLFTQLQRFSQQYGVERETIFMASWALITSHITKSSFSLFATLNTFIKFDFETDTNVDGRKTPILVKTTTKKKITDWLQELQQDVNKKHSFAYVGFDNINQWVGLEHNCQSFLAFNDSAIPVNEQYTGIACNIVACEDKFDICLDFNSNIFEEAVANRMLQLLEVVICSMVENPLRNPAAISMRTPDEQRQKFWKTLEKS